MQTELNYTWITAAISAGGTLSVYGPIKGNRMVRALMEWQGENGVLGDVKTDLADALNSLNEKLCEDAANEMMGSGTV